MVKAALDSSQAALEAAVSPVAERVQVRCGKARDAHRLALGQGDEPAAKEAKAAMDALVLFRTDMQTFLRLYTFLSRIFDDGNTAFEKRAVFFKHLLQVLTLERERTDVDVSGLKLTHHTLKSQGKAAMALGEGEAPKLEPLTAAGSGAVQEKQRAQLQEIIEKVNALFEGTLTDQDKLVYVNDVLKGKLLENETLAQQAANNTKEQFASSPDLQSGLTNAIMEALDAHAAMSTQALNSKTVQAGLLDILLNHAGLWVALKQKSAG
ncbi:MAG: Type restriction enzyme protein [Pseudomonadota bacterium]